MVCQIFAWNQLILVQMSRAQFLLHARILGGLLIFEQHFDLVSRLRRQYILIVHRISSLHQILVSSLHAPTA